MRSGPRSPRRLRFPGHPSGAALRETEPETSPAEPLAKGEPAQAPRSAWPSRPRCGAGSTTHARRVMAGYQADTALISQAARRPVYAIAAGTSITPTWPHAWTGPSDTANCVRFELDTPSTTKAERSPCLLRFTLQAGLISSAGGRPSEGTSRRQLLGVSGSQHSPHLHIGLLLDGDVTHGTGHVPSGR